MRYVYAILFNAAVLLVLGEWIDDMRWQTALGIGMLSMMAGMVLEKVLGDDR